MSTRINQSTMNDKKEGGKPEVTLELARWAASLRYQDLPESVVHQFRRSLLDYYCAVLAGSTTSTSRAVQSYFSETELGNSAGVVGTSARFSPHTAAFINGTAGHGLELDDGYTPGSYHPAVAGLPAVMAVAEAYKANSESVIVSGVIAYEISCRLARAGHPLTWKNGFHNTGINGVFGCAAGVGYLLGLDTQQMTWALGMAGSFSSGLFEFLGAGSEVKRLHPGKCARDGVLVAEFAKRGVDGPSTGIEGENGYFKAYAGDGAKLESVLDGLGEDFQILNTYVKPYPCCRHLHAPIDAILALKRMPGFLPESVDHVRIETNHVAARHCHTHYSSFLDAQMSIPYATAVAILFEEIGLTAFGASSRALAEIARIVPIVEVVVTDAMNQPYPRERPARVIITFKDGRQMDYTQRQPYGEPDNPLDDAALVAKFYSICDPLVGHETAASIHAAVWDLDLPAIYRLTALDAKQVRPAVN